MEEAPHGRGGGEHVDSAPIDLQPVDVDREALAAHAIWLALEDRDLPVAEAVQRVGHGEARGSCSDDTDMR